MKIDFRRVFKRIFGCKCNPVYRVVKIPKWSPKEDITIYELALCKDHPRRWRDEDHIIQWWGSLPENLKRHYELVEQKCVVDWDY